MLRELFLLLLLQLLLVIDVGGRTVGCLRSGAAKRKLTMCTSSKYVSPALETRREVKSAAVIQALSEGHALRFGAALDESAHMELTDATVHTWTALRSAYYS